MKEAYVVINSVPSHVMTWGKWIEESFDDNTKEIVLCITGNPGLPGFYTQFMKTLYENLNIPVWVIAHAGHGDPPDQSLLKVPDLMGNESIYNLQGQINHKLEFIEKYIPHNIKIHLIGHSIGCYIITELLKCQSIRNRVQKSYLLFPTLERMAESPNGKLFLNYLYPFLPILKIFYNLLYMLPNSLKIMLIYIYFWLFSIPNIYIGTVLKYLKPTVIEKVSFLAKNEMDKVRNLDVELIKSEKDLLKFYCGTTDGWAPLFYYKEMLEKIPDLDCTIDDKNIKHAFVLNQSAEMGIIVAEMIQKTQQKNNK